MDRLYNGIIYGKMVDEPEILNRGGRGIELGKVRWSKWLAHTMSSKLAPLIIPFFSCIISYP